MRSDKITFVVFTFNEEARVERAIWNFGQSGRVLVVDNYSTDRTEEIALAAGAEVIKHKNPGWVEDEYTASVVKDAVKTPWIYWGFADEMISRSAMSAMLHAIESDTYSIVSLVRKNYYYGEFLYDAYASPQNRAFRKEAIDFTGNTIHKFGTATVPESRIFRLDSKAFWIHHFISNTAKSNLNSMNRYTDIEVERINAVSSTRMIIYLIRSLFGNLLLKGGYKAGSAGLLYIMQMAFYNVVLAVKSYEKTHQLSTSSIEERNNIIRDGLLREFSKSNN